MSELITGKVFEGTVNMMNMNYSYRLTFDRVEGNEFDCQNGLYSKGFGELMDNSKTTNGTITFNPEGTMQLKWSDEPSDFVGLLTSEGILNGDFLQVYGDAAGQKGTFELKAVNQTI